MQSTPAFERNTTTSAVADMYCTFHVAGHYFGVSVSRIQELIPAHGIQAIPQAPPPVTGLINLRGQIVTVFNLREALGFPRTDCTDDAVNIIAHAAEETVSLLVDRIGEVVDLRSVHRTTPPDTIPDSFHRLLETVYQIDNQLLLILEIDNVVTAGPALS